MTPSDFPFPAIPQRITLPGMTHVQSLEPRTLLAAVPAGFTETTVASGLSGPTAMAFAPDGRLFVAEQTGALRVIKNGTPLAPAARTACSVSSISFGAPVM